MNKRFGTLLLMTSVLLGACTPRVELSLDSLQLAPEAVADSQRVQVKSAVDTTEYPAEDVPLAIQSLRQQKLLQTAYWKYHLNGERIGFYKVKLNIFRDQESCAKSWLARYPEAALVGTQSRDWGDAAFIVPGKVGAFSLGRLNLQVEGFGDATEVEAVLAAFAAQAGRLKH